MAAAYAVVWLVASGIAAAALFLTSSRTVVLLGHEAVVRPDLTGYAVVDTGPVLPDVRLDSGGRLGLHIELGKTDARSTDELLRRYAAIASQPEGQVRKLRDVIADLAVEAALRGAVLGTLPVLVWVLIGARRRRELRSRMRWPHAAVGLVGTAALALALWQPWTSDEAPVTSGGWQSLGEFLGPEVPLPAELAAVQVRGDVLTGQTRRLVESAVDTYRRGKEFYARAEEDAAGVMVRPLREGETVVAVVADRHDNVGMDPVARRIADAAGATAVFDAGDDTSTGSRWESFSLDSVTTAFDGLSAWGVAGNHDNGDFVEDYLADRGWTMLDGDLAEGPGGITLLGVADPRSSGLGSWRDETGLSFEEVGDRLADAACSAPERVATVLVHDAALGRELLDRGCADLVIGGHLHLRVGPQRVEGRNGEVGYTYTTGTTGGAAYAFALGSKLRRDAMVSLVTYGDGRPVGLQWVTLQTDGVFRVGPWTPLTYPR